MRRHSLTLAVLGLALASVASCRDAPAPTAVAARESPDAPSSLNRAATVDEYIVTLRADAGPSSAWAKAHGVSPTFAYLRALNGFAAVLTASAAAGLEHNPHVLAVAKARRIKPPPKPTPTTDSVQSPAPSWGLDRIDQASATLDNRYTYLPSAGANTDAYVIDTGVRCTHVDFGGRCDGGADFVGDGYGTGDCYGHGTSVAGIIVGTTYGVAKRGRVHPLRVIGCDGVGSESTVIAALEWVIANVVPPAVVNMSLETDTIVPALDQAVENTIAAGFTVVVAAGNAGVDACTNSPASATNALTVGSAWQGDVPASGNYGPCLDLYAPGANVFSIAPWDDVSSAIVGGTSHATPHVSGAALLYLGANPLASPASVMGYILSNASLVITGQPAGTTNRLLRTHVADGQP